MLEFKRGLDISLQILLIILFLCHFSSTVYLTEIIPVYIHFLFNFKCCQLNSRSMRHVGLHKSLGLHTHTPWRNWCEKAELLRATSLRLNLIYSRGGSLRGYTVAMFSMAAGWYIVPMTEIFSSHFPVVCWIQIGLAKVVTFSKSSHG